MNNNSSSPLHFLKKKKQQKNSMTESVPWKSIISNWSFICQTVKIERRNKDRRDSGTLLPCSTKHCMGWLYREQVTHGVY